jgi:hypothetical protein
LKLNLKLKKKECSLQIDGQIFCKRDGKRIILHCASLFEKRFDYKRFILNDEMAQFDLKFQQTNLGV